MYKKMVFVLAAVLALSIAQFAAASDDPPYYSWSGAGDGTSWTDLNNWLYYDNKTTNYVPTALPDISSRVEIDIDNANATISSGNAYAGFIAFSNDSGDGTGLYATNCTLNVTGGQLDVTSGLWIGNGGATSSGILNISDGKVIVTGGDIECSYKGSGVVNMTGGELYCDKLYMPYNSGSGQFHLDGGVFYSAASVWSIKAGSIFDITNGMLVISKDVQADVTALETAGLMTAFGGAGSLVIDYNGDTNITTVTAVPEPATMMLLALGGLGLLRRKKIV